MPANPNTLKRAGIAPWPLESSPLFDLVTAESGFVLGSEAAFVGQSGDSFSNPSAGLWNFGSSDLLARDFHGTDIFLGGGITADGALDFDAGFISSNGAGLLQVEALISNGAVEAASLSIGGGLGYLDNFGGLIVSNFSSDTALVYTDGAGSLTSNGLYTGYLSVNGDVSFTTGICSVAQLEVSSDSFFTGTATFQGAIFNSPVDFTSEAYLGYTEVAELITTGVERLASSARSGAGAVPITHSLCKLTSTGAAQAITLANAPADGQLLEIIHDVDGGSMVLTPATKTGYTTITFTNVADSCVLRFFTGRGWCIMSLRGAVAA